MVVRRKTTRLWLVCHAPTSALRSTAFPADETLEPGALERLRALAPQLRNADYCWSSPALRAVETAQALGMRATIDPMLRDCDYGDWGGQNFDEVHARNPEAVGTWLSDPLSAPHGGESIIELIGRVATWLDIQRDVPGKTLAFTHASIIRAAVIHVLGAPANSFWRVDIAPLSLTKLSRAGECWTLASIGEPLT